VFWAVEGPERLNGERRDVSLWNALLGVENKTVLESVEFDQDAELVVARVRPTSRAGPVWSVWAALSGV
jgi:hypothetical protein